MQSSIPRSNAVLAGNWSGARHTNVSVKIFMKPIHSEIQYISMLGVSIHFKIQKPIYAVFSLFIAFILYSVI